MLDDLIGKITCADCLDILKQLPDKCIDLVLTDPPYATTNCSWDKIVPMELLWVQFKRIIKENGCVIICGNEPFSSMVRTSNLKMYRYDWIWEKTKYSNFLCLKNQPAKNYENLMVFYNKQPTYNPQMQKGKPYTEKGNRKETSNQQKLGIKQITPKNNTGTRYPNQTIFFPNGNNFNIHPTQKPLALFDYIIKTYTNENDLVLDCFSGSGTTAVACHNLHRRFICIEKDPEYAKASQERLEQAQRQQTLF